MSALIPDISKGVENVKISIELADRSYEEVTDFVYVRKNIPGPGTQCEPFVDEFEGCECKAADEFEEECDSSKCSCQQFGPSYDSTRKLISVDPYENHMKPVRECNKHCSCSKQCSNRVVQLGVQYGLQVFFTKRKGFGLRTLDKIKQNTFVCEYAGEILTEKVAKSRTELLKENNPNYILVLREHLSAGKIKSTYVDPTYIGNVGRFINHSCQPNLYMVPVRVDCDVAKLALFAVNDIEDGEELCYDYSGEINTSEEQPLKSTLNISQCKPCYCGAKTCRGVLPMDPTLYSNT